MKKLIFYKLYIKISLFFFTSLIITGLIVWTIQAVNFFDYVTEDGHGLKVYFYYSILNFPKIIQRIFPFVFFISVFFIIINYEQKNEMIVFWINGINKINFINNILIFSLFFMFLQIILGSYFSPMAKLLSRDYLKNSNMDFFTSLIKEGKFINVTEGLTIFIDAKDENGELFDIFLEESNEGKTKMIYAKKGYIEEKSEIKNLKLFDGKLVDVNNSEIKIFEFDQIDFNLTELNSKTILVPKIQELNTRSLINCLFDLKDIKVYKDNYNLKQFDCNQSILNEIYIELTKRIYKPIYIPIIVLLSCYIILFSKNQKHFKKKTNIIFLTIILIMVFSEVSVRYVGLSIDYQILFFLSPIFIFIFGYYFFHRLAKNV